MVKEVDANLWLAYRDETRESLNEKLQLLISREIVKTSQDRPVEDLIKEVDAIAASMAYNEKILSCTGKLMTCMIKRMSQRNITEIYESTYDIIESSLLDCPREKISHVIDFRKKLTEHSVDDYVEICDSITTLLMAS